jgi:hypothetical protein
MFGVLLNEVLDVFSRTKMLKSYFLCSSTVKGKKILYIEELPEMNHTIFYCECQHHRKTFYVAKLMGEGPKDSVSCQKPVERAEAMPWHWGTKKP